MPGTICTSDRPAATGGSTRKRRAKRLTPLHLGERAVCRCRFHNAVVFKQSIDRRLTPRKAMKSSILGCHPPRMFSRKDRPTSGAKMPFPPTVRRRRWTTLPPICSCIASRVAPAEDVREAVRESVERRRTKPPPAPDLVENRINPSAPARIVFQVNTEIELTEFELADHLHAGLEITGRDHLVQKVLAKAHRSGNGPISAPAPGFPTKFSDELARRAPRHPIRRHGCRKTPR